jgi:hypothetical protein
MVADGAFTLNHADDGKDVIGCRSEVSTISARLGINWMASAVVLLRRYSVEFDGLV